MTSRSHYAISSLVLILSRMLVTAGGFAVVVLLATKFGASALSDAYFAARLIPITLIGPLGIAFNLAFVPEYIRIRKAGGERQAAQLAGRFLAWTSLGSGGLSLLYVIFADYIVNATAPGFSAQTHDWAVSMTRIMAPAILLTSVHAVLDSVMNARRRYIASAVSALSVPVGALVGVLVLADGMGADGLAIGAVSGFIVQVAVLFPLVRHHLARRPPASRGTEPPKSQIGRYLGLTILGLTGWQINTVIDRMFGSMLVEGAVTALSLGTVLIGLVPIMVAAPVYKVMYPELVQRVQERRHSSVRDLLRLNFVIVVFTTLPITVALMLFAPLITDLAFSYGHFDAAASAMMIEVIFYGALSLPAGISGVFLAYYFLATKQTRIIIFLLFVSVTVNALLDWLLMHLMGIGGIALGTSLVSILRTAALLVIAGRVLGGSVTEGTLRPALKTLLLSAAAAAVMYGGLRLFQSPLQEGGAAIRFGLAAAIAATGALIYFSLSLGIRHEALLWLNNIRNRRAPGGQPVESPKKMR